MAWNGDEDFKCSLDSTWSRGAPKAQISFSKALDTISAACACSAASNSLEERRHRNLDEEVELEIFVAEKRGLLNIDLNVAPPEDDGSEYKSGGNGEEIGPAAVAAAVASGVCEKKVSSGDEHGLDVNGIAEVLDEVNSEISNGIQAHWSKGETNGFDVVENEAKHREEKGGRNKRWNALIEVAENILREYEENLRNKDGKIQNRKRREVGLGGGVNKGTTPRKKVTGQRSQSSAEKWNDDGEVGAVKVLAQAAQPLVVRSTRGRAVAMPNKYRDSILDAVAEFPRHNKSGKSATVVSNKRKSR